MPDTISDEILSHAVLRDLLQQDIARIADEEGVSLGQAFLRVCIEYLGLNSDSGIVADGAGDHGLDYVEVSSSGANIIQSKSFDFDDGIDFARTIGPSHITDLPRIRSLFENLDALPATLNSRSKRAMVEIKHHVRSHSDSQKTDPFLITVHYCAQAHAFTEAAKNEFHAMEDGPIPYGGTNIAIEYSPVFLTTLLDKKWRQSNTRWRNQEGEKKERFDFSICGTLIRDKSKSFVFFTKAAELVDAYREIGYQLFEPNVRCEIKNSSVNKAIRASIRSHRGREEFKHLNNGITIVCDGVQYVGARTEPGGLRLTHPGVINGLQTIKTLADAVQENLSSAEFAHFRDKCQILTRVHTQQSVGDYRDLVKSTNNQNPMKPRNLRSNEFEQILFEKYFAEKLGWFYERKEGAWNAFKADPVRWSTINRKPKHFQKRSVVRTVDNEGVAQAWFALIGFSDQAVDQKRYLFAEDRKFYDLIFRNRTTRHGRHYRHAKSESTVIDDALSESPKGEGMLTAYLVREFAKSVVLSRKENREAAVERLRIGGLDRATQEKELADDTEYLNGLVLRSMLLMFVEFFGYAMFSAFGSDVHSRFASLLENGTLRELADEGDFAIAKTRVSEEYSSDDVLVHLWELYSHCVSQMIAGAWMRERRQAANISKFTYSEKTREPLYAELGEVGRLFRGKRLIRKWTIPFNETGSVEEYLRANLD